MENFCTPGEHCPDTIYKLVMVGVEDTNDVTSACADIGAVDIRIFFS